MEEPLQPRAPQLRAGALREQSGEAATPASLGGPTLSRQPLLAPAFSSDTAPPPAVLLHSRYHAARPDSAWRPHAAVTRAKAEPQHPPQPVPTPPARSGRPF